MLLALVRDRIDDRRVMDLVAQYLRRTVDENCLYTTVEVGISLGCPLFPVNQTRRELRVEQHPDKTFVGWIQRGFTFLG